MSKVSERGNIYFFYRPRKEEPSPTGWEELQRAYVILSPDAGNKHRLITIGHKKLPEISPGKAAGEERVWGFVDAVSTRPEETEDKLEAPVSKRPTAAQVRRVPRLARADMPLSSTRIILTWLTPWSCRSGPARCRRRSKSRKRPATSSASRTRGDPRLSG